MLLNGSRRVTTGGLTWSACWQTLTETPCRGMRRCYSCSRHSRLYVSKTDAPFPNKSKRPLNEVMQICIASEIEVLTAACRLPASTSSSPCVHEPCLMNRTVLTNSSHAGQRKDWQGEGR